MLDLNLNHKNLRRALDSLLKCSECHKVPSSTPTFQCSNGHLICQRCYDKFFSKNDNQEYRCRTCDARFSRSTRIRNRIADAILCNCVHEQRQSNSSNQGRPHRERRGSGSSVELKSSRGSLGESSSHKDSAVVTNPLNKQRPMLNTLKTLATSLSHRRIVSARSFLGNSNQNQQHPNDILPLGIYQILSKELIVNKRSDIHSTIVQKLNRDLYLDIVEIEYDDVEQCIRGKLSTNGYVTLQDTNSGEYFCKPFRCGLYKMLVEDNDRELSRGDLTTIEKLHYIPVNTFFEISEMKLLSDSQLIIGRLYNSANGFSSAVNNQWVGLIDTSATTHAEEFVQYYPIGCYYTTSNETEQAQYLDLIDLKYVPDSDRVRGCLSSNNKWISVVDTSTQVDLLKPVPTGIYKVFQKEVYASHANSDFMLKVLEGTNFVEILETRRMPPNVGNNSNSQQQSCNLIRGRISCGGWIDLIDTSTNVYLSAQHYPMGYYQMGPLGSDTYSALSCEVKRKYVYADDIFHVKSVKSISEKQCIRVKIEGKGWMTLESDQSAKAFPLLPGPYRVTCEELIVTDTFEVDSKLIKVLQFCMYVNIVSIQYFPKEQLIRGMLHDMHWITLVNEHQQAFATPIPLGMYKTVDIHTDVFSDFPSSNEKRRPMKTLGIHTFVNILQVKFDTINDVIYGKLASLEGWIALINTIDGYMWAKELPIGTYKLSKTMSLTNSSDTNSGHLRDVPSGSYIDIVNIIYLKDCHRVRGKCWNGGWCDLIDINSRHEFAKPIQCGVYVSLEPSNIYPNTRLDASISDKIDKELYFNILQTRQVSNSMIIRGKIPSGEWINLMKPNAHESNHHSHHPTMFYFAEPVKIGVYEVLTQFLPILESPDVNSNNIGDLAAGTYVNVVETKILFMDNLLRGRLSVGGWIHLKNIYNGQEYCTPLPLGVYKTVADTRLIATMDIGASRNEKNKRIFTGTYLNVIKFKLSMSGVFRGELSTGGYITIYDPIKKLINAKPVPLGMYKIMHKTLVTEEMHMDSKVKGKLEFADVVKVMETSFSVGEKRLRARIDGGGWISIENISDGGTVFAEFVRRTAHGSSGNLLVKNLK